MTVTREALTELVETSLVPAVSILMPAHRAGPEIRQDPIRLKNLVRDAETELAARGFALATSRGSRHPSTR